MIRLVDKSHILSFNFFYVFCIVIYAGSATVFARDIGDIRTVGNAFALMISVVFFFLNRVKFSRSFFISVLVFLSYAAITSIINRMINPLWISKWLIWLTIAYLMCYGLGTKLFGIVETVLFYLCIIDIIFWLFMQIMPNTTAQLINMLSFSKPYAEDDNVLANIIVFTLGNSDYGIHDFELSFGRNPGFAWEPGAFASMICLGIYCNVLRKGFRLRNNYVLWVFLIALFTTQSTTGFSILLTMLAMAFLSHNKKAFFFIVIPVAIAVFTLPFIGDKITTEIDNASLDYVDMASYKGGFSRTLSLIIDFQEFLRHPIIGLGGWTEGTELRQLNDEAATISGIGELLVTFGAVGTIIFLYMLIKSCIYIKSVTKSPYAFILFVPIILSMYSYVLWCSSLYISFWMFGLYASSNHKRVPLIKSITPQASLVKNG